LQSFDFNDHVVVAGAAVERVLLVLAGATGKGVVVGDELDEGFEGGVEAVDAKVQLQEGEC
jgi:hypothetical protein